ncbi:hypothetical protein BDV27DRAFT_138006 [Aspergillus caelatus]|uniref:Uncharacterized protein n=1 Tax=Aspergillus caelatus TaxID=61420 RepID=A0A5N6ZN53_9EURO|nr:uncharacterized protein BDV27DRAFT_138006 [Aspergillus caelatus]KAE8358269.1 hypothetical protein BDV27DRAFT_138006 [Aspergillus caelatus]
MPRRKKLIAGWQPTYMICAFRFICSGMCGNSLGHPLSASQRIRIRIRSTTTVKILEFSITSILVITGEDAVRCEGLFIARFTREPIIAAPQGQS